MKRKPSKTEKPVGPENTDYDPHRHRQIDCPMNNMDALISVIKCSIGTGCLAMPMAFYHAGWLMGIVSSIVIGIILVYTLHLLVKCMYELCKRHRKPQLSYIQSMMVALRDGPPFLRCLSIPVGILVDFFLGLYHFGACCIYIMFMAENIKQVVDYYLFPIDARLYMGLLIIPVAILLQVPNLKTLVPFFATANILFLLGFSVVLYYICFDLPPLSHRNAFQSLKLYPLFFGTILFAMESVGVMLAIEANMKNPKDFLGMTGILNRGMAAVIFVYCTFGFLGYWRYGPNIQDSITLNLPAEDILPQIIKIMFALAIYFSYGLQGYIAVDVIWYHTMARVLHMEDRRLFEHLVRFWIAVATVFAAIMFPDLGLFLSLMGSLCLSFLCLIFPALLDICILYRVGYGFMRVYLIRDIFLFFFGIVGCIQGSWVAVNQIMATVDFVI